MLILNQIVNKQKPDDKLKNNGTSYEFMPVERGDCLSWSKVEENNNNKHAYDWKAIDVDNAPKCLPEDGFS